MNARLPLAALALVLLAGPALARPGGDHGGERVGPGHGPPPPLSEILAENADEIGLDDATLDQLMALLEAREPELKALHEELRAARQAGEAPDESLRERMRTSQQALMGEVEALLDADELEALRQLLPPPPGKGGRGPGGDGPPCHDGQED